MSRTNASELRRDAILLAGGRITGAFERAVGSPWKGVVRRRSETLVERSIRILRETGGVGRICVIGPEAIFPRTDATADGGVVVCPPRENTFESLLAGMEVLHDREEDQVLAIAADLPYVVPDALEDLLVRTPPGADVGFPVIRKEALRREFPGDIGVYVPLADGPVTGGSAVVLRGGYLTHNATVLRSLVTHRKSQFGMARQFGLDLVWNLITHRLSIQDLERRISERTGGDCRAVDHCRPEISFDLDNVMDYWYYRRRESRSG